MLKSSPKWLKTLWEKEKLLVTSNFSFSHSVFKRLLLQIHVRKNSELIWERVKPCVSGNYYIGESPGSLHQLSAHFYFPTGSCTCIPKGTGICSVQITECNGERPVELPTYYFSEDGTKCFVCSICAANCKYTDVSKIYVAKGILVALCIRIRLHRTCSLILDLQCLILSFSQQNFEILTFGYLLLV